MCGGVVVWCGVCVAWRGVVVWWHAENPRVKIQNALRVSIQNVPVCAGTTRTC